MAEWPQSSVFSILIGQNASFGRMKHLTLTCKNIDEISFKLYVRKSLEHAPRDRTEVSFPLLLCNCHKIRGTTLDKNDSPDKVSDDTAADRVFPCACSVYGNVDYRCDCNRVTFHILPHI